MARFLALCLENDDNTILSFTDSATFGEEIIKICQMGLIQTSVCRGLASLHLGKSDSGWGTLGGNNRSLKLDSHLEGTDLAWVTKRWRHTKISQV